MNQLINKLCSQAISDVDGIQNSNTQYMYIPDCFRDRFAELIVRECLKEIKDMIVDENALLYPNNNQTTHCVNDRLLDTYDNITEHFGVKE